MTKPEFAQLAQRTYSFNQLPAEKQQEILALEGEEREYYVKIFSEENGAMIEAVSQFQEDSDGAIKDFKITVKQAEVQKLKDDEVGEKKEEEAALQKLLKKI